MSPQLEELGRDISSDEPAAPSTSISQAEPPAKTATTRAPEASSKAAVDDLDAEFDDIDNLDLDKLLAGKGIEDGIDSGNVSVEELTLDSAANELDDLDDFLASLDS